MSTVEYNPVILVDLNVPWEQVLHLGTAVSFALKQIIPVQGISLSSGFYYVRKGRVRLSYLSNSGQEKVLFYIGRGTLFNEIPSMTLSTSCVFTCMEPVSAVFFKSSSVRSPQFVEQYPDLMLNWVESISAKSNNFFTQLCTAVCDSFANVCRVLYRMALHNKHNGKIVPQLSQQEVASLLGIHRGSLHKALTRLKKENIIGDYSRKELEVFDMERLRGYAEE